MSRRKIKALGSASIPLVGSEHEKEVVSNSSDEEFASAILMEEEGPQGALADVVPQSGKKSGSKQAVKPKGETLGRLRGYVQQLEKRLELLELEREKWVQKGRSEGESPLVSRDERPDTAGPSFVTEVAGAEGGEVTNFDEPPMGSIRMEAGLVRPQRAAGPGRGAGRFGGDTEAAWGEFLDKMFQRGPPSDWPWGEDVRRVGASGSEGPGRGSRGGGDLENFGEGGGAFDLEQGDARDDILAVFGSGDVGAAECRPAAKKPRLEKTTRSTNEAVGLNRAERLTAGKEGDPKKGGGKTHEAEAAISEEVAGGEMAVTKSGGKKGGESARVASADGSGSDSKDDKGPSCFGDHLSDSMREKILKGKYVDIFALLNRESEVKEVDKLDEREKELLRRKKPVRNWSSWLPAYIIYMGVIISEKPERGVPMLRYLDLIYKAYSEFGGGAWLRYDESFRSKVERHPALSWEEPHVSLWLQCMTPVRPLSGDRYDTGHIIIRSQPSGSPFQAPRFGGGQLVQPRAVCWEFNSHGFCSRRPCKYKHSCSQCGGFHPIASCSSGNKGGFSGGESNKRGGGQGAGFGKVPQSN